ncbi:MAG: hypothetical protein E6R11_02865 [Rhodocyclaceae bacterium]|nr:MAG: hypothetical protein EYC71_01670 [Gammaproteobacteria bacterium]TXG79456.1 MAG: hypothetical protein E6R11_02865 [Rhodocyclaceae bacterium]
MSLSRRAFSLFVLGLVSLTMLGLSTSALAKSRKKILEETLRTYAATIRWGSIEQAESFVDPAYRANHPLTALDLERYKQVRITYYNETAPVPVSDFEVRQTVEIGLVNVNSQEARSIIDRQVWKYDREKKAWLLTTGLPDITRGN